MAYCGKNILNILNAIISFNFFSNFMANQLGFSQEKNKQTLLSILSSLGFNVRN